MPSARTTRLPFPPPPAPLDEQAAFLDLALAAAPTSCSRCCGLGRYSSRNQASVVCACVYRHVFQSTARRYRQEREAVTSSATQVQYQRSERAEAGLVYGFPSSEFIADFEISAKAVLVGVNLHVFNMHVRDGHDFRVCCAALKINRGVFFHHVYRMQERLGREWLMGRVVLYPLARYFRPDLRLEKRLFAIATRVPLPFDRYG